MSILSCFSSVPLLSSCHGIVARSPVGLNTRVPGGGGSSSPTGVPGGGGGGGLSPTAVPGGRGGA